MRLRQIVVLGILTALAVTAWMTLDPLNAFGEGSGSPSAPRAMRGSWTLMARRPVSPPGPPVAATEQTRLLIGRATMSLVAGTHAPVEVVERLHAFADGSVAVDLLPEALPVLPLPPAEGNGVLQLDRDDLLRLRAGTWEFTWMRSP